MQNINMINVKQYANTDEDGYVKSHNMSDTGDERNTVEKSERDTEVDELDDIIPD